jgi:YD repeat-containing protein
VKAELDPQGKPVFKHTLGVTSVDGFGRAKGTQGDPQTSSHGGVETSVEYDGAGRPVTVTDNATGLVEKYEYLDVLGRQTKYTREVRTRSEDSSPVTEVYTEERTYLDNSASRVVQVKESVNGVVAKETTLRLDRAGRTIQREEIVPGNKAPALWVTEYDAFGNAWKTTGPEAFVEQNHYDVVGNSIGAPRFCTAILETAISAGIEPPGSRTSGRWWRPGRP